MRRRLCGPEKHRPRILSVSPAETDERTGRSPFHLALPVIDRPAVFGIAAAQRPGHLRIRPLPLPVQIGIPVIPAASLSQTLERRSRSALHLFTAVKYLPVVLAVAVPQIDERRSRSPLDLQSAVINRPAVLGIPFGPSVPPRMHAAVPGSAHLSETRIPARQKREGGQQNHYHFFHNTAVS